MNFICFRLLLISAWLIMNMGNLLAQDLRSDSADILHIDIHLDITDISGGYIEGHSTLSLHPLVNNYSQLRLDLLKMNVDSIVLGGQTLNYTYNDTLLNISLGNSFGTTDTFDISIFYRGNPVKDLSNWGGFYFQSGYAFNLGVGFEADPHNYGRVWFPCFDNFVERSTFRFEIITSNNKTSYCNGELTGEVTLSGDTIMRTWEMNESIPTYLACVAVGPYSEVRWIYQGIQRNIPVQLAVRATDSNKLKGSFVHLDDAMDAYEGHFGPYLFNKVGYSVVPFGSGAMEHASNIAYPNNAVNGNTSSELLMAHELSHHWWGDLVTCETAEDMWLNEGWASFSEHLFLEHVYGRSQYIEEVKANHLNVIQYAHYREEEYRAVSGIPHEYTYGMHVYDKGASVAHNLRAYMGDSLFFGGIQKFLDDHKFSHVSSTLLRDDLSSYSGIDLSHFFNDWVFGAGYTHISIDSFVVSPSPGLNQVEVYIRQKKRGSDHFFTKVPVLLSYYDQNFNRYEENITVSGEHSVIQFQSPVIPQMMILNESDNLVMAVTADQQFISSTGAFTFDNAKMQIEVEQVSDSFLLRLEHHWAHADEITDPNVAHRISNYRYWKVDGIFPDGLTANATLEFDGRDVLSGGIGHLDDDLLVNGPDSIILLYRKDASHDWWEYQHYTKVSFASLPFGRMELDSVMPGEYAFANGISAIGIKKNPLYSKEFRISPNPTSDLLNLYYEGSDTTTRTVFVFNVQGKLMERFSMNTSYALDVSKYRSGNYMLIVMEGSTSVFSGKFVVGG